MMRTARNPLLACIALLAASMTMAGCATAGADAAPEAAAINEDVILTGPLTIANIPDRFLPQASPPLTSRAALLADLAQRGNLTLSQARLDMGSATPLILAADELRLSDATILTQGTDLTIFVRRLVVDDRSPITAFGSPLPIGAPGSAGAGGGRVHIYIVGSYDGQPRIALNGGTGGPGGPGTMGSTGAEGPRGHSAHNGSFGSCQNGPGGGGRGGAGGRGGQGQAGMAGGPGGTIQITFVNQNADSGITDYFTKDGGQGGAGGPGGRGGDGGRGGLGGANAGNCQTRDPERNRGAAGTAGPTGPSGPVGPTGAQGNAIVERIDIAT